LRGRADSRRHSRPAQLPRYDLVGIYDAPVNIRLLWQVWARVLAHRAAGADQRYEFHAAYRGFLRAADSFQKAGEPDRANTSRFKAAISLEKSQDWRANSALWENLGDRLGEDLTPKSKSRHPNQPGQSGMFHVISTDRWGKLYEWYYEPGSAEERRHEQALSYMWGAAGAESAGSLDLASSLYRKAGIAWELTTWGDRDPRPGYEADVQARETRGEKWLVASNCFFHAAYNAAQSISPESKEWERVLNRYTPSEYGWQTDTDGHPFLPESDVERLVRCWKNHGETRHTHTDSVQQACEQLSTIQLELSRRGRRKSAIQVYRMRERLALDISQKQKDHWWRRRRPRNGPTGLRPLSDQAWATAVFVRLARGAKRVRLGLIDRLDRSARRAHLALTNSGSSLLRTFASAIVLYVIIFPAIYWSSGVVEHSESHAPIGFGDSIIFTLANLVSLSVRDYVAPGVVGATVQTLQAVSAYFVLGYVIWQLTRSFET
jgi:hypothetical protein